MDYETIAAYLAGECDPLEKQAIEQWRKANTDNEQNFLRWQLLWQASQANEEEFVPDARAAWQKVNPLKDTSLHSKSLPILQTAKDNQVFIWVRNLAAMLLLVAGLSWAAWELSPRSNSKAAGWVEKTTLTASKDAITLKDGTKIWLNGESKLRYPEQFTSSSRDIYLEGEAYFEVTHQPDRPFLVHTSQSVTQVLGTTFTVRSYAHEPTIEVNLLTGKVSFSLEDTQLDQKKILKPGQKAILHKESQIITVTDRVDENHLAWKTNKLIFKDIRLEDALEAMEDYYKVEFTVADSLLLNCRFTGTFDKASLADVLDVFAFGSDISYRKQGNLYILSGAGCQ